MNLLLSIPLIFSLLIPLGNVKEADLFPIPVVKESKANPPQDYCNLYGSVYIEEVDGFADYKVFVEDVESFADMSVFEESTNGFADRAGLWYFTNVRGFADFSISITDVKAFADFSIYKTQFRSVAGCRK